MNRLISYLERNPFLRSIVRAGAPESHVEKADVQRATLLLKHRAVWLRGSSLGEDFQALPKEVERMTAIKRSEFVEREIREQVVDMFETIEAYSMQTRREMVFPSSKASKERSYYLSKLTYALEQKPSTIVGAGYGVFVHSTGTVPPGTVVALYPGAVHMRDDLKQPGYLQSLLPDEHFLLTTRLDDIIIDGRKAAEMPHNPFALGHLINHCGADRAPNVMQVSFDFTADSTVFNGLRSKGFSERLQPFIPNRFAQPRRTWAKTVSTAFTLMPTVVLLSTEELRHGDELLLDYRLNPTAPDLPAWYKPYDAEQAKERWQYVGGNVGVINPNSAAAQNPQPAEESAAGDDGNKTAGADDSGKVRSEKPQQ